MSYAKIINEAIDRNETQTVKWVLKLLHKYPTNMVIAELEKYVSELEAK
jgi:hypothetical protein